MPRIFKAEMENRTINEVKRPRLYFVIMHNDDYTPMDFVVLILCKIFKKTNQEAEQLMMKVHKEGACKIGPYTYDIALTRKGQADRLSAKECHPLKISLMPESVN